MRRMRIRIATLAVIATLVGGACSDDTGTNTEVRPSQAESSATSQTSPSEPPSVTSSSAPPDNSPEAAEAAYREAVANLVAADTGRVSAGAGTDSYGANFGGSFELSSRTATGDVFYEDPGGRTIVASYWSDGRGLLRELEGERDFADPCWTA